MPWNSKGGFWALVLCATALCAVPSISLIQAGRSYFEFLTGFEPDTLRSMKVRFIPHKGGRKERLDGDALRFMEFTLEAPKAKKVCLTGDFAQWKTDVLPLSRGAKGTWEILLPLPPGRYHYLFIEDGRWTPDPKNALREKSGQHDSSVMVVK